MKDELTPLVGQRIGLFGRGGSGKSTYLRQAWLEGTPLHSAAAEAEAAKLVRALEQERGGFAPDDPVPAAARSASA